MKKWKKFEKFLHSGDWHVHTNYTDGKNTVFDYCNQAVKNGLNLIAFTEHVRKEFNYDFNSLISDVQEARQKFNLKILYGCEAKVLNLDGDLDVTKEIAKKSEIVLGAFHSSQFINEKQDYLEALKNMLRNPYIDIWAHPGRLAQDRFELTKGEIEDIIECCIRNNVLVERNRKYDLPENRFMKIVNTKWKYTIGSDAHSVSDLHYKTRFLNSPNYRTRS